jgi:3-hydroxy-3-methylglutaryl CoA synthase
MVGICSHGGYVPRYRLSRSLIYKAMGWMNAATVGSAKGEKAVANFDEDSITLAVAAGRDGLEGCDRSAIEGLYLASTTMPYKERLNAGIVSTALGLNDRIRAADFTGGLKAGTTALLAGLDGVASGRMERVLVCASDCRLGKPASSQEMILGDASAAFVLGREDVIAELKGSFSTTYDFVDHYRGEAARFDRQWEDRWIRDMGFERLIPEAVQGLMDKYGMKITDFSRVVYPCIYPAARKKLNKILGFGPEVEQSNLQAEMGESGAAHALLMLSAALEQSKAGDRILVVSFGGGCDALCFEVTDHILRARARNGISGSLANRADLDNYTKYLVWRNILPADGGLRSEEDEWTRWSTVWRKRKEVLGLWGSKCRKCGTAQYPQQRICVNPDCGACDEMEEYPFADKSGRVASFTADMLASSVNPPAIYGHIEFEGRGRYLMDLTDCELSEVKAGLPVVMSFRRKYVDEKRGIRGYFWKAVPKREVSHG